MIEIHDVPSEKMTTYEYQQRNLGTLTFNNDDYELPPKYSLDCEKTYVLSCFWSNIYIKGIAENPNKFTITQTLGEPIQTDREYVLICPKY